MFDPQTILERVASGSEVTHQIFGTGVAFGEAESDAFEWVAKIPLWELRRDPAGERWIDHGTPAETRSVVVGPASSASVMHTYTGPDSREDRYVFVTTGMAYDYTRGSLGDSQVHYRHSRDGVTWTWQSLGGPTIRQTYGAPLAMTYSTGVPASGGRGTLAAYVTALNPATGGWELYHRFHDGVRWNAAWENDGRPSDIGDQPFEMTSTVTWWDGNVHDMSALRIEIFGHTRGAGDDVGKLVHRRWDGGTWVWMPSRTAPDGKDLRTTSSVAAFDTGYDRISAFVRTSGGRIYEHTLTVKNGQSWGWEWRDLSWERLVLVPACGAVCP